MLLLCERFYAAYIFFGISCAAEVLELFAVITRQRRAPPLRAEGLSCKTFVALSARETLKFLRLSWQLHVQSTIETGCAAIKRNK